MIFLFLLFAESGEFRHLFFQYKPAWSKFGSFCVSLWFAYFMYFQRINMKDLGMIAKNNLIDENDYKQPIDASLREFWLASWEIFCDKNKLLK